MLKMCVVCYVLNGSLIEVSLKNEDENNNDNDNFISHAPFFFSTSVGVIYQKRKT